jgi:nucleotidyltransferase/DNA polymerase involved in DNA repair
MAKRIPAGEMRHVVTIREHKIEAGTTAYDSYGQLSVSSTAWETGITTRAKIEQLSADELVIARQIYPSASYRVTVDYNSTLARTGGTRRAGVFGSRFLFVGGIINPDLENVQLQLLCGEER